MRDRHRVSMVVLAAVTSVGLLVTSAVSAVASEAALVPASLSATRATTGAAGAIASRSLDPQRAEPERVTLITGDRVALSADGKRFSVLRGEGRSGVRFLSWRAGDHLMVVPTDAQRLLAAGRLDSRLFDVTLLREFGYQHRADLPVIIRAAGASDAAARAKLRSSVTDRGIVVDRELPAINGLASRVSAARPGALWQSLTGGSTSGQLLGGRASKVWLDGLRRPVLDVSVPQIGAPAAWRAGFDGTGVTVAVLDSGIDTSHKDLAAKVTAEKNFTDGREDDKDHVGHGTHVASTIAGTGAASNGKYKGVAPGAKLLDGKVCVADGCAESAILAGMQWAVEQKAAVVNLSLGGPDQAGLDPLEEAVNTLTARSGTLFVIAAGNEGEAGDHTVGSPASADAALAVGAVDSKDQLAVFSSRGPLVDGALKPDITAPGVDITAARSSASDLVRVDGDYTTMSGTSMATPHVAGAAAILKQRRPSWAAGQLKAALMASAKPTAALGAYAQGAGRVDLARAIDQLVTAEQPSVSLGRQTYPHNDDIPVTKTVTYRNAGSADVALSLAVQTLGPDGSTGPAGMFTLSASTVNVPAGGTAAVTITADTRVGSVNGLFSGWLTAAAQGGVTVQTPFAVERESEVYDVTFKHVDRKGAAATSGNTMVIRTDEQSDTPTIYRVYPTDEDPVLRLPKARYAIVSQVVTDAGGGDKDLVSMLVQPRLDVTADQTVTLDSRLAKPVSITPPRSDAVSLLSSIHAFVPAGNVTLDATTDGTTFDRTYTGQVGPKGTVDGFYSAVTTTLTKAGIDGPSTSPYAYNLAYFLPGKMVTGFSKQVDTARLAAVNTSFGTSGTTSGIQLSWPSLPGKAEVTGALPVPVRLPHTQVAYYNTDQKVSWLREVHTGGLGAAQLMAGRPVSYQPGRTYTEQWNTPVFGPNLINPILKFEYLSRQKDTLAFVPALFSDSANHNSYSDMKTARMSLTRNGQKVFAHVEGRAIAVDVPKELSSYQFSITGVRDGSIRLATKVNAVWTFTSGHVDGDEFQKLPISTVRFTPALSLSGTTKAGTTLRIPVTVQRQEGSAAAKNKSLSVQVSFNDGKTWANLPVRLVNGSYVVEVKNPGAAGFVSLQGTATDTAGNTAHVSIIRAYQITR